MKKIAVVLSGCGYLDGAEITESVSLLIELSRLNIQYDVFAPNKDLSTVAHLDEKLLKLGQRNALEESARITRGKIRDLEELSPNRYDGLALPGGYGVAKNLSNWAQDGPGCLVNKKLKESILSFYDNSKPILGICIAPAVIARVIGNFSGVQLTIGSDPKTASAIEKMGADHIKCKVTDFVTDRENKVITTPAYMLEATPYEVFQGIASATKEFVEMC